MVEASKFQGTEGTFITSEEAAKRTKKFHEKKKEAGSKPQSYVEAQFFGKKNIMKLLDKFGDECAGLRIYYTCDPGKKDMEDGLLIVPVNAEGKDLTSSRLGLKDMPADREEVLADGPICPRNCNP
ncbi:hypothetical protein GCM10027275_38100 [Rhabdobacter roseus]|uniref:Uncharacterized protein n=1 Tax=Rhabdobacter roseus TaxID=1655419 RepID=A0A840TW21_9BACT|nr:hypothetical protein [Rhabdobacter roseus]MBB5285782.1 hypothetical protein [Rhabdobacter roseus]